MLLSVAAVNMLTPEIKSIRLASPDGDLLTSFTAGAHVDIGIPLPGALAKRKYSLVSDPCDLHSYEIAVKRNVKGRGGSAYLHDEVDVGSMLEVGAPVSELRLQAGAAHHVFIAGGIGITPLLGMAASAQSQGLFHELHYAARSRQAMAFHDAAVALPHATTYFSEDGQAGRLDIGRILDVHRNRPDVHVYVCGPARLIDEVRWSAEAAGFGARQVHFESFGPAWTQSDGVVELFLEDSRLQLSVAPGVSLLDAMDAAGVWIPSECRRGECGACITSYSSGVPLHRDNCLTPEERGHVFCPCVSWADTGSILALQI